MTKKERITGTIVCKECGTDMTDARIAFADVRKFGGSWLDPEAVSPMTCCVCPECGRIELYADFPERFRVKK